MYLNTARYELIREVKKNINIPLIANGDIDSPEKAKYVLDYTGADAVMIGRAAQGRPWIFREIAHYLETGEHLAAPEIVRKYMYIGPYQLSNNLIVAPMAGVTDRPFRTLCKYFGAGHAVSEMMTADKTLRMSKKSLYRANFDGELAPISAQIAGSDPEQLAEAARYQVANGAQIVDINMGCPAKKVCNKLAGSALLQDGDLVARILDAVVAAVDVPVTLKTRLGFLNGEENILRVAKRAEDAGRLS